MQKKQITTGLIGKDEIFKLMALAETTQLGMLLVGPPGVGKTKSVLDYAVSTYNGNIDELQKNTFVLETDEGTKASQVKGTVDIKSLTTKNEYKLNTPIANSEYIVINEVDKGSSAIRNSLLGVMNERILFNGDTMVPCNWKLFVATCNEIPQDEKENPFWDRFLIKYHVSRMSAKQMLDYFSAGDKKYKGTTNIRMPEQADLDAVNIPLDKLTTFVDFTRKKVSDRTLSFVPTIAKAISLIWNVSIDKALVKTASLLVDDKVSRELAQALIPQEMRDILNKLDKLQGNVDAAMASQIITDINNSVNDHIRKGILTTSQAKELEIIISEQIDANEVEYFNQEDPLAAKIDQAGKSW